ncbi:TREX2 complex subunit-like (poorly characterized, implicated in transcription or splicing) [Schizosaccharomyces osmophilus]|uniref:TREX2 complex subunit-like (Poorly characterized, implicated in transcription or splicing) n=1 Tax=Schizosaccharomyces osmophilus TaxID=2545709 RepID=A0AAF0AX40_9SCHI|nr:TREX2 complex subunit-like (poorly characterized, implicated in transcription or splicing) [Schizosaccharomyces osmophilus]WBW73715.1 TREX2 complex subunit-like (poorly characterized, implicated in transcription or splicing) [Schizosaccharomyces osmophilus]
MTTPRLMPLNIYFSSINNAVARSNSMVLAKFLSVPWGKELGDVLNFDVPGTYSSDDILGLTVQRSIILQNWSDSVLLHLKVLLALCRDRDPVAAFRLQVDLAQNIFREFSSGNCTGVHLPVLFIICKDLRFLAIHAQNTMSVRNQQMKLISNDPVQENSHLELATRLLNRAFTICINDRAPLAISRKWGAYYTMGLLFKLYLRLDCVHLTNNVLRAMKVVELPDISLFPKSHIVIFRYYLGIVAFLNQSYKNASAELETAFSLCHKHYNRNLELILSYWIPTRILVYHQLPSPTFLSKYPYLKNIYVPLCHAIKKGNLGAFGQCLKKNESLLAKTKTYLTLEGTRDLCLRNLFRKTWIILEKSTRLPTSVFQTALKVAGSDLDLLHVEAILANMVSKGYMRGYVSRDRMTVVLSAKDPFPKRTPL